MNSNRLLCLKCTLLEGYKHQQQNLNDVLPSHLVIEVLFFDGLPVDLWHLSTVRPLHAWCELPQASSHLQTGQHGNVWTASHRLSNLTSVYSLMFPRQVHTTRELPFQISLVFSMTLILFSMQGHFRKTTKVKGNRLLCKMNAESRQGLFAS